MEHSAAVAEFVRHAGIGNRPDRDEERDLAGQARAGDRGALERLVTSHIGFVIHLAKEFRGRGVPFEDLIAEGCVGLLKAVRRFDPSAGTRFITFSSFWVRKALLQALSDQPRVVRVTRYAREHRLAAAPREVWIDPLAETLPARSAPPAVAMIALQQTSSLRRHVLSLSAREQAVLATRYGLHGDPPLTLSQVGARMGISRERVRQIEVGAIDRLRRRLTCKNAPSCRSPRR